MLAPNPEELAAIEEAVKGEICEQRPVQAVYHDDERGWLRVRICVSDVKFLYTLRANVLESVMQTAIESVQAKDRRIVEGAESRVSLEVDLSSFVELYEATCFTLDKLTAHQRA